MNCWEIFLKLAKENAGWVQVLSSDPHVAGSMVQPWHRGGRDMRIQELTASPASPVDSRFQGKILSWKSGRELLNCWRRNMCAQHMNMYTPYTQRLKEWCWNPQKRKLCESPSLRDWAVSGWWEGLPFSPVVVFLTDFLHCLCKQPLIKLSASYSKGT